MKIERFNNIIETVGFICAALIATDEISRRGWLAAIGVALAWWAIWIVIDERNGLRSEQESRNP